MSKKAITDVRAMNWRGLLILSLDLVTKFVYYFEQLKISHVGYTFFWYNKIIYMPCSLYFMSKKSYSQHENITDFLDIQHTCCFSSVGVTMDWLEGGTRGGGRDGSRGEDGADSSNVRKLLTVSGCSSMLRWG